MALIFFAAAMSVSLQIRHSIPATLMRFGSGITPSESQRSSVLFVMPMCLAASAVEWPALIGFTIILGIREIRMDVKFFFRRTVTFLTSAIITVILRFSKHRSTSAGTSVD